MLWFRKKPIEISIDGLMNWFEEKAKPLREESDKAAELSRKTIVEFASGISDHLTTLKDAQLRNPQIPVKELQIMEGNRDLYIQRWQECVEELKSEEDDIDLFITRATTALEESTNSTQKARAVLTYFFNDQIREIAAI